MSKTVVLFWLGASSALAEHRPVLDSWARARWVKLTEPVPAVAERTGYDEALVAELEELLDQARLSAGALDDAAAGERLDRVEQSLRKNTALPQAAWLMAEALQIRSEIAARSDPEARTVFDARRRTLEGLRAPSFGEPSLALERALATRHVRVDGARAIDRFELDGEAVSASFDAAEGEHHLRVLRGERLAWSGWVQIRSDGPLPVAVPPPASCSREDFAGSSLRKGRARPAPATTCAEWAIARPTRGGAIEIASCRRGECGPLVEWRRHYGEDYAGPPQPKAEPGFPAWATWALVGAGVALVGTGVAWQAGAFDEPEPGSTRFRFYGPQR